jgi:hypothetical protein
MHAVRSALARGAAKAGMETLADKMAPFGAIKRGDDALNRLWKFESRWNLADRMSGIIGEAFPGFEGAITVRVVGGPDADIRRVWYLTLATAFGRYRNGLVGRRNHLMMTGTWDVTGKACQVELFYHTRAFDQFSGETTPGADLFSPIAMDGAGALVLGGVVGDPRVASTAAVDPTDSATGFIQRGPEQLTVGGGLPNSFRFGFGLFTPGFETSNDPPPNWSSPAPVCVPLGGGARTNPFSAIAVVRMPDIFREFPLFNRRGDGKFLAVGYPSAVLAPFRDVIPREAVVTPNRAGNIALPDENRVITTGEKNDPSVQPPSPPIDGRSRGSLMSMVAQALQRPCFQPEGVACTTGGRHNSGAFVSLPWSSPLGIQGMIVSPAILGRNTTTGVQPQDGGADGRPVPATSIPNMES